jgi:predicted PurR-regulated permease PerM
MSQARTTAVAVVVLAVCGVMLILYLGREVFVPIALAVTFAATLRPVVQRMERWRIPAPAGTGILLLGELLLLAAIGSILVNPAKQLADKAPQAIAVARQRLAPIQERLARLGGKGTPAPADTSAAAAKASGDSAGRDSAAALLPARRG